MITVLNVIVKLRPPYSKPGEKGDLNLELPGEGWDLIRLAKHLTFERRELVAFDLVDAKDHLTAEFIVNARHAPLEQTLAEGDEITVIPYICGG